MEDLLRQIIAETNGTVRLGGSNASERWQGFVHAIRWDEVSMKVKNHVQVFSFSSFFSLFFFVLSDKTFFFNNIHTHTPSNKRLTCHLYLSLYLLFFLFTHHHYVQPWIVGLLSFHIAVALAVVLTRKRPNFQLTLFMFICGIVYFAEHINTYFRQTWKAYGWTQNYFDPKGVFITIMYSAPLLCIAGGQMVRELWMKKK